MLYSVQDFTCGYNKASNLTRISLSLQLAKPKKKLIFRRSQAFRFRTWQKYCENVDVDILTRGNYLKSNPSSNTSKANYIFSNRLDFEFLQRLNLNSYDLIFDNNCYVPECAKLITDLFKGLVVAVSSSAVSWYEENRNLVGKQNKGISYEQSQRVRTYAINKESCELVYMKANGSVIRLPNILSLSDPNARLKNSMFFYKQERRRN